MSAQEILKKIVLDIRLPYEARAAVLDELLALTRERSEISVYTGGVTYHVGDGLLADLKGQTYISAIKLLRERLGLGLKQAKDLVDELVNRGAYVRLDQMPSSLFRRL